MSTFRFRCGLAGVRTAKSINQLFNGGPISEAALVGAGATLGSMAPYLVAAIRCRLLGLQKVSKAICLVAAFDMTAFDVITKHDSE